MPACNGSTSACIPDINLVVQFNPVMRFHVSSKSIENELSGKYYSEFRSSCNVTKTDLLFHGLGIISDLQFYC